MKYLDSVASKKSMSTPKRPRDRDLRTNVGGADQPPSEKRAKITPEQRALAAPRQHMNIHAQVSGRVQRTRVRGTWWYYSRRTHAVDTPGPQAEAVAYKQAQGHRVLVKWGTYHFGSFARHDDFVAYIQGTVPEKRHFYEVLIAGEPQRMFCEMDGLLSQLPDRVTEQSVVSDFERLLKQVFATLQRDAPNPQKYRWTTSSQGDKLSLHWVYCDNRVFRHSDDQKRFWQYVRTVVECDFPRLLYVYQGAVWEPRCVIDDAVYTANRAMRTIFSSKQKDPSRVLQPYDPASQPARPFVLLCFFVLPAGSICTTPPERAGRRLPSFPGKRDAPPPNHVQSKLVGVKADTTSHSATQTKKLLPRWHAPNVYAGSGQPSSWHH